MASDQAIQMLINTKANMVALESHDPWQLIARFRKTANQTGESYYVWRKGRSLGRLGIGHFEIPNTASPETALRYIARSKHYGVYILQDMLPSLADRRVADLLFQIAEGNTSVKRKIILLEQKLVLPEPVRPLFQQLKHQQRSA